VSVSDALRARAVEEQVAVMKEQLAAMQETFAKIERKSGELLDAIGGLQNQINTLRVKNGAPAR
jgi:predicted homoserine dehydrogenase-like protein